MKKRIEFRNIMIVAAIMLCVLISISAKAQDKAEKNWTLTGNTLTGTEWLGSSNNQGLIIKTNNTERLRITDNGFVGIGTTDPYELFSVGSSSQFQVNSAGSVVAHNLTLSGTIYLKNLAMNKVVMTDGNSILTTGLVNLTSQITAILPVENGGTGATSLTGIIKGNGTNAFTTISGTDNYLPKWSGGSLTTTSLIYDDGTNVGIGVINPQEKLEINGCLKFDSITPPVNSSNGTIAYNGKEMLVRKNNKWMTLMYVGPWDTVGNNITFTDYNVGLGIMDPRECLEIAGGIRLGNYNFSKTKGDTVYAKEGTILFDGTNILAKAKNQWYNITDEGTTPPPVIPLWDINPDNSTVFCLRDKVAIGGMTADANLHLMNRDKEDPELKMRYTHHFEIDDWNITQEEPLTWDKKTNGGGKLTEMTKSIDVFNKYGNIYFAIEGAENAFYNKFAITSTTIQSGVKFLCEGDIISKSNIYACKNVWVYGGNGCTPMSHPVPANLYVKGISLLDGNTAIGTIESPANLIINSNTTGLIVSSTNPVNYSFNIVSRVINPLAKAITVEKITDKSSTESFVVYGNGDVVIGDNEGTKVRIYADGRIWLKNELEICYTNPWKDFVFEKDYKLMPITQLEEYVNANKHLPDVPSSKEIEKNGLKIAEMESILLQKIEEQTLYIIELNKMVFEQNKKILELESKLENNN